MGATKVLFQEIRELQDGALEGEIDSLIAYTNLREIKEQAEQAMDSIRESALKNFRSYGERELYFQGYKVSETAGGKYDYKDIQEWTDAKAMLSEIEKKAQEAYKTGAEIDGIIPAIYCSNKSSLSFKLKK